jgi:2-dehydropantoate 2-reductase
MSEFEWPRFAVLGAGAVGCYFGGMLARAGAPVTLVGRAQHVEALVRDGLHMQTLHFEEWVGARAAAEASAVRDADIVLLCVKTLDTEEAAKNVAPHLAPGAIVLSLQNGVDNVERIRRAAGIDALAVVVYVAAEMTAPGQVKHSGRGDLVIGELPGSKQGENRPGELEDLAALFERAQIPCRVSPNIEADLWTKLVMNCAYNAISALGQARYGRIVANAGTRRLMTMITQEVVAVGTAAGVSFPEVDLIAAVMKLGEAMADATSSTAQDLARGKRTEIDSLNGYVARRGAELGVPAPINQALHALIKLLEEGT